MLDSCCVNATTVSALPLMFCRCPADVKGVQWAVNCHIRSSLLTIAHGQQIMILMTNQVLQNSATCLR